MMDQLPFTSVNFLSESLTANFKSVVWDYFHIQYYTQFLESKE